MCLDLESDGTSCFWAVFGFSVGNYLKWWRADSELFSWGRTFFRGLRVWRSSNRWDRLKPSNCHHQGKERSPAKPTLISLRNMHGWEEERDIVRQLHSCVYVLASDFVVSERAAQLPQVFIPQTEAKHLPLQESVLEHFKSLHPSSLNLPKPVLVYSPLVVWHVGVARLCLKWLYYVSEVICKDVKGITASLSNHAVPLTESQSPCPTPPEY